ncbi:MAG: signal peptidase II [Eubacterium sp.]|nr:signal peptidase II [Eubacterium sp.]
MVYLALAVAAGLIGLDQLTKIFIDNSMHIHETFPIIAFGDTQVLNITYEQNTGAAFSILEGKQIFLIIVTGAILLGMLFLLLTKRIRRPTYVWCVALILAGGIGNLIDRLARGFVVDFIDFRIINFAVFNVADICAVIGSVGLLVFVVTDEIKDYRRKKAEKLTDGEADVH